MFKRLYISTVLRNFFILAAVLPLLNFYVATMIYRVPNMQKEKILDYISENNSALVLNNPILNEYHYFYIGVSDKGEVIDIGGAVPDKKDDYLDYIIDRYFKRDGNFGYFLNVIPEDPNFNHVPVDGYYYSAKLIKNDIGINRIDVVYTSENAGYFIDSLVKNIRIDLYVAIVICVISLLFAFWEVRPARKAWKEQKAFFANASHELRTPLMVVSSALEHVKQTQTEEQSKWISILDKGLSDAGQLANDLLFLAKIDAKRVKLSKEEIRLDILLLETYISMEVIAIDKGVKFEEFKCDEALVFGDGEKLRQLISILLRNAIENTPSGGVVSLSGYRGKKKAVFLVRDTGKGIDKSDFKKIFRRFYRAESQIGNNVNAGLGLSIAKWIVKKHKGQISVYSEEDTGSTFSVILPSQHPFR